MPGMTTNPEIAALVERLRATIHSINGHWWNRRKRPEAPDIHAAADALDRLANPPEGAEGKCELCDGTGVFSIAGHDTGCDRCAAPIPIDGGPNVHDAGLGLVAGHAVGRMAALGMTEPMDVAEHIAGDGKMVVEADVERVAKAIYAAHVKRNKPWKAEGLFQKERWRASARAALAALPTVGEGEMRGIVKRVADGERSDGGHTALRTAARAALGQKEEGR